MYNVEVGSINEVDLSVLEFPQVAVYNRPEDFPHHAVARVFDNGKPTNMIVKAENPELLKKDIRENTSLVWFPREKEDVRSLVGVYL